MRSVSGQNLHTKHYVMIRVEPYEDEQLLVLIFLVSAALVCFKYKNTTQQVAISYEMLHKPIAFIRMLPNTSNCCKCTFILGFVLQSML